MKIRRKELDGYLRQWGVIVSQSIDGNGYPKMTTFARIMEGGIHGAAAFTSAILGSYYWPNKEINQIHQAIQVMETADQELLVYKRVLDYSYSEIGKIINLSKWGVMKRMDKAEDRLFSIL